MDLEGEAFYRVPQEMMTMMVAGEAVMALVGVAAVMMKPRATSWHIRQTKPADLAAVLQLFGEAVAWLNACGSTDQCEAAPVSARPHLAAQVRA